MSRKLIFPHFSNLKYRIKHWNKDCISSRRCRRWTNWICGIQ